MVGGDRLGGPALGLVGLFGGLGAVGGAGRGELGAALRGRGLAGLVGGGPGGLPCGVPGGDRALFGVVGGEGRAGRVGVRRGVVEPARAHGFGGLLLDLGEALAQVTGLAAGALGLGGGGGGVPMRGLARGLEGCGALLLLVGHPLPRLRGGVQGAYEVGGGRGAGGQGGGRVALGLPDGDGDTGRAVGGGTVAQHGFGGLPGGVQGAGLTQLTALCRRAFLGGGQGQGGVPVGQFGRDEVPLGRGSSRPR